jgi:hypothetical protein
VLRAEQWLEDQAYIVPAPIFRGAPHPAVIYYTITDAGMSFMKEG